jgi:hypothetical protein
MNVRCCSGVSFTMPQCSSGTPSDAEIRMIHVRSLHGRRNLQRHFSKLVARHFIRFPRRLFLSVINHFAAHSAAVDTSEVLFHRWCEQ